MIKIKLGDVLDIKRGMTLSGEFYSSEGNYIRLTLGNFNYPDSGWKENTSKKDLFFTGKIREEFVLKKGDIITPLTEQVHGLLGNTATIPEDNLYIQSGDIGLVKPDETKINKRFAYYLLSSSIVKKQLDVSSQQTKIRHTSPGAIKSCIAFIPNILEQKKIASILDSINLKINNNNKINDNLEQQAKLLYDYWFSQFDFPDKNGKPYCSAGGKMVWNEQLKRNIPENWKVVPLSTVLNFKSGFSFSSDLYVTEGKYKLLTIKNVQDSGINLNVDNYINDVPSNVPDYCFLKVNDILMSLTGNVGRIGIMYDSGCILNQRVALAKSVNEDLHSFVYFLLKSDIIRKQYETIANGSSQKNLSPVESEDILIAYNEQIAIHFASVTNKHLKIIVSNLAENEKLIHLRDWLLPMLMNGQATITD